MRILVTGASGFAGAMLVPRLLAEGHEVRALARSRERAHLAIASQLLRDRGSEPRTSLRPEAAPESPAGGAPLAVEVVEADAVTGAGLARALEGIDVAYYLIHSMEKPRPRPEAASIGLAGACHHDPADEEDHLLEGTSGFGALPADAPFAVRELAAAQRFAAAARVARVGRIVYLGGLVPTRWAPSQHLASREAVERTLLSAIPDSLALRASVVVAARSRSFRLLVHLLERLPVLALADWRHHRTQPIDGRDLVAMLVRAADIQLDGERSIDVAGPDVLSYGEMLEQIADAMLVHRPSLHVRLGGSALGARVAAAVAGEDPTLTVSLMEGLKGDLLPRRPAAESAALFGVALHSFESAVEHALREWEAVEPLAAR